jgi:hypothetical protein
MKAPANARAVDRARSVLLGVVESLTRGQYTYEQVRATYCRRSAQELLADGHVHFATPCHDFATVAMLRLTEAGFAPTPALLPIRRWLRPLKFQVGLELTLDGDRYYVGASTTTNRLAPGRFVPTRSRPFVHRACAADAPPGAALLRFFGIEDLSVETDRLRELLPGYDHEADLRSHRSFASPSAFEKAYARALEKFRSDGGAEILGVGTWRLEARPDP